VNVSLGGQPGNSDPYLKVSAGKFTFDDRKNAVFDTKNPYFYKCITIQTELPGISQLKIELTDYNTFGSDKIIGTTCIDLEDRFFDGRWQKLGFENRNTGKHVMCLFVCLFVILT
jgi:Ca2+-dependent lipid-binding protein